uniref:Suppressor protein SRP40-like n=1 Tax=Syphacia muris TaxID=451379 RepID=A0A0N5A980_9BILA
MNKDTNITSSSEPVTGIKSSTELPTNIPSIETTVPTEDCTNNNSCAAAAAVQYPLEQNMGGSVQKPSDDDVLNVDDTQSSESVSRYSEVEVQIPTIISGEISSCQRESNDSATSNSNTKNLSTDERDLSEVENSKSEQIKNVDQPTDTSTLQQSDSNAEKLKAEKLRLNTSSSSLEKSFDDIEHRKDVVSPSNFTVTADESGSVCAMGQSVADSSSLCSDSTLSPDFDTSRNLTSPVPSVTDSCRDASSLDSLLLGAFSKFKSKRWRRRKRDDQISPTVTNYFSLGQKVCSTQCLLRL